MALPGQRHRNYPLALPPRVTLARMLATVPSDHPIPARTAQPIIDSAPGAGTDSFPDELARLGARQPGSGVSLGRQVGPVPTDCPWRV